MNADGLLAARDVLELDNAVDQSKEGVVAADSDIIAGMNRSASLSYDDVAGLYDLTAEFLESKPFGMRLTTVL